MFHDELSTLNYSTVYGGIMTLELSGRAIPPQQV